MTVLISFLFGGGHFAKRETQLRRKKVRAKRIFETMPALCATLYPNN
jgi:hypothetical protein